MAAPKFESHDIYWRFARATTTRTRYIHDAETRRFLDAIVEGAPAKVEVVPRDCVLRRAQLGHRWRPMQDEDDFEPACLPPERMVPLADKAREGRANPKGIPYLYAASHLETAIAEVRPWNGSYVSVAEFQVMRDLRVVDFTVEKPRRRGFFRDPKPEEIDDIVWSDIDTAFSLPVTNTDEVADYVPTQIIADLLRSNGYDGVAYRSAVGPGHNLALFDLKSAEQLNGQLYRITGIKLSFTEETNPYFISAKLAARSASATVLQEDGARTAGAGDATASQEAPPATATGGDHTA